ncbi:MAG: agmatine deiminase family protein [Cyclobacteriaceae bacterium]|nr:agmatine deiminase family protein [Cyclobacteriaceae bacterium]
MVSGERFFACKDAAGKEALLTYIKRLLGLKRIHVVPPHPYDEFGHVDGLVRYIDHETVLINDLSNEEPGWWVKDFKKAIAATGYKTEELPYRPNDKGNAMDAKGIYMNFLKLYDLIIMPAFTFEKEDKAAKETLEHLYPGRMVETIYATDLAKEGGIVNCVTYERFSASVS